MTESDAAEQPGLWARLMAWVGRVTEWVMALKPVRVFTHYGESRGPILASGLAFQAIFAVFGGLWVGFSIAGLIIANNIGLRASLIEVLAQTVPGLIESDTSDGIVDPETLLTAGVFGWTGAIALVVLLLAALNWLAAARDATRVIFELPPSKTNFVLLKAKDLGLAVGFGALLLVSAGLSVVGTFALDGVLQWMGIRDTTLSTVLGRTVTLAIMFVLDAFVLGMLYRVLAGVKIPLHHLWQGALIGALALGGLKVLGSSLLGGASNNPLLASFAVLLGLLIWFNFVCQAILIAASWIAVGVRDDQLVLDEKVAEQRLEQARQLVAAHEPEAEPAKARWFRRLFGRR
ncbi:MAG: YihY/virulence factor BrkB family protein [Microcella sp.]|uniref:YihY/virulence factor BrkB family protein n=1 Tax=Microcella sp. TaxID=1913979 RepID=UPI0024C52934|nr:YihY/virulence factor BrkB family protein [Microcella sp.]UYN82639.1 MAG: YihY/virulence factor BrkB family protein [Microcella sp.]